MCYFKATITIIIILLLLTGCISQEVADSEYTEYIVLATQENYNTRKYQDTFIAAFINNSTELHFVATLHSDDPQSLTFQTIDSEFENIKPDLVIVEKYHSGLGISPANEVNKFLDNNKKHIGFEGDYAVYKAVNNKNKTDFLLAEPTTEMVLDRIRNYSVNNRQLSTEDVLFFYTIRGMDDYISNKSIKTNEEFIKLLPQYIKERIKQYAFPEKYKSLTANDFLNWYKQNMNMDFDFKNIPSFTPIGNDSISIINKYVSLIRDQNIINNIAQYINKYKKILVVYGMGHYVRLKPTLEKMFGCEPEEKQIEIKYEVKTDLYNLIKKRVRNRYSVMITKEGNYRLQYYGQENENLEDYKENNTALATGWYHYIFYLNKTDKKNLAAVLILGMYYGNEDRTWQFFIDDMAGNRLYESENYRYSDFPKDQFEYREYPVNLSDMPEEFAIIISTRSNPNNGLFIMSIPTKKGIFSFEYQSINKFMDYRDSNAVIIPKFD